MPINGENIGLIILLVSMLIVCFVIAIVAMFAIFNKKNQLNQKEKQIMRSTYEKTILQSQLEIQEQTFNVISGELHDNVGQILSLAKVQINIMNEGNDMSREMLDGVKENISKAMNDLRDIAKGLSSDRVRMMSICDTVQEELDRINKTGILRTRMEKTGAEHPLDEQKKLILFRIIQESIQNCIKHAAASEIQVCFGFEPEDLKVSILDNGKGFVRQEAENSKQGLGLMNIKRRAWLAGGEANIESILHSGTSVKISIPYE